MAPSLEVTSVPIVEEGSLLNKSSIAVDIRPVPENDTLNIESTSSSDAQSSFSCVQASHPKFQLEEHPIDDVPEIRVSPY